MARLKQTARRHLKKHQSPRFVSYNTVMGNKFAISPWRSMNERNAEKPKSPKSRLNVRTACKIESLNQPRDLTEGVRIKRPWRFRPSQVLRLSNSLVY